MAVKVKEAVGKMREMTPVELKDRLKDVKEELFNLRFQLATGHLEDFTKIRQIRRNIARIQTVLKEKELGIR
ncbi:MAG: 50S ribosomal protein L29 [bacterium]